MLTIGFFFARHDFRYAVLEGDSQNVSFVDKAKVTYPKNLAIADLMNWLDTQLELIIQKHQPDNLAHKISLQLKNLEQIQYACYPQAILNLVASKNKLPITSYSGQSINATKFGLPKSADEYAYVDQQLGAHPPHWDKQTKDAVLVAWFNLLLL